MGSMLKYERADDDSLEFNFTLESTEDYSNYYYGIVGFYSVDKMKEYHNYLQSTLTNNKNN